MIFQVSRKARREVKDPIEEPSEALQNFAQLCGLIVPRRTAEEQRTAENNLAKLYRKPYVTLRYNSTAKSRKVHYLSVLTPWREN